MAEHGQGQGETMKGFSSYDRHNDILSIHKGFSEGEKFKGCIEIGDMILDMSTKRRIRGIEILNASDYLQGFFKLAGTDKKILENLVKAKFRVTARGNSLMFVLALTGMVKKRQEEIPATIAVPVSRPLACH
jgi:uncharacterized protein YuzE